VNAAPALRLPSPIAMSTFIEKRQEMSEVIAASQRATSEAMYALHDVKRAPVPYKPTMPMPVLSGPLPSDTHLERSADVVSKRTLPTFQAAESMQTRASGGKPWASFEQSQPGVFDSASRRTCGEAGQESGELGGGSEAKHVDADLALTSYNEWNLQKNGFNPDVAAQMRINVRKSANIAAKIQNPTEKPQTLYSSHNIKLALGEGEPEPAVQKSRTIAVDQVFPQR